MFAERLKKAILQAAIQGKLTEQLPTDGDARDLLKKIRAEKAKLIAAKKIKADKPLLPISDDEILFDIPNNWCWVRLGEVCQINPRNKLDNENIDATFLPMTSISEGYSNSYNPFVRSWNEIKSGFTHFADGDVILAKITPCFQNRKSAIVQNLQNGIGAGTTELHVLRPYGKLIHEKYLLYFVKNQQFINDGVATMKGTAGQQRVSRDFIANYLFPLPPLAEQKRIVERVNALLSEVAELAHDERELTELEENFPRRMKNSLLQAAIQGKLTEQLPIDGDARDLLQKIRAEKAKLITAKKIKAEKPLPPVSEEEIPFDLPDNWCWCRLGEIFCVRSASRIHQSDWKKEGVPFWRGRELVQLAKGKPLSTEIFISEDLYRTLKNKSGVPIKDDILISAVGTIGKVYIVKGTEKFYYKDAYILCFENFGNLIAEFVRLVLESPFLQKQIHKDSMATTVKQLTIEKSKSLMFPLPPLAEQQRIVERLEELLPICENLSEKTTETSYTNIAHELIGEI